MAKPDMLDQAHEGLNKSMDICHRLHAWCVRHPASDAPLTALVHQQIKRLVAQVFSLGESVNELDHSSSTSPSDAKLSWDLAHTKERVLETVELLDFHNRVERCGQDGALNAAFATTHILVGTGADSPRGSYYNQYKLKRISLELHDLTRDAIKQAPSGSNCAESFDTLRLKFIDFLTRTAEQFEPRHVCAYGAFADTPYVMDAAGDAFSGSFGMVQKVSHRKTGESLAMKTFRVRNAFLEKDRKTILRELGILEVCFHKNIVELVEAFSLDNGRSIRLVMSPWAPCTLAAFLQASDMERADRCPWFDPGAPASDHCVFRIMFELADAVRYLHDKKIKHKDLKPDNILLYQEGTRHVTPLVTDVGVSKIEIPGGLTKYTDSTYAYLAPEQHNHESSDLRSDIWQLGCCFAELFAVSRGGAAGYLTLHESFNRDGSSCCIAMEHRRFIETLGEICLPGNPAVKRTYGVVMGMLELDPADRLDISSVLAQIRRSYGVQGGSQFS